MVDPDLDELQWNKFSVMTRVFQIFKKQGNNFPISGTKNKCCEDVKRNKSIN